MKSAPVVLALAVGALGACARQQRPVVLTPVRVDSASVVAASTPSARGYQTASDDPFARIDRLDWPGPNRYRAANGAPGPDYWQQRADYTIAATLDTAAQTVSGTVTIRYTNNSPDTLTFVWLQLDQNLYAPGSKGSALFPAEGRWGVRGFQGGYQLADVTVDGKGATPNTYDTMMRLDLPAPLRPRGGTTTISMRFSFRVPEHGSDRMGRDGALYEIAQWYPRMAVFDDVRGWNTDPYLGQGEFYLEYGDIDYSVTAPAGYTIAGSGVLQNPEQVLSAAERQRLAQAQHSTTVVPIVPATEAVATPTPGTKTWRFRAQNVRDVAWAGAPDFRWDAVSTGPLPGNAQGVLAQAYYQEPKAGKAWESGAEQTQWTIKHFSEEFFPFPYPQATSVAGPVGGMEYPMFVMVHYGSDDPSSIFGTINHEHGHEWFPMIVGSNERRYAWQDEGFNTYIDAWALEARYAARDTSLWSSYLNNWKQVVAAGTDVPLMTPPDRIPAAALGAIGYRKPGAVLLALRDHVLGRERFDKAFRTYIERWAFKHPTPADFFRTIEDGTGEDLAWYWRAFWYTTDLLDIGIEGVRMTGDTTATATNGASAPQRTAHITLRRMTSVPFPVELRLRLADSTTKDVRFPVQIWYQGPLATVDVPVTSRVVGVRLWPDSSVPDWNPANDTWGNAPAATPLAPVTAGGLNTRLAPPAAKSAP